MFLLLLLLAQLIDVIPFFNPFLLQQIRVFLRMFISIKVKLGYIIIQQNKKNYNCLQYHNYFYLMWAHLICWDTKQHFTTCGCLYEEGKKTSIILLNPISKCFVFCLLNSEEKNEPTEGRLSARVKLTVLCIKFSSQLINAKERIMRLFELDEV